MPNVGKSSLVRVLSSGVPEVCNYPFTTRSIKMGRFYIDTKRHQVGVAAAAAAAAAAGRHQVY
jgi:nucleolar GTP-binding protein